MKIIIDILHPAHVHVFKNFIRLMKERGHQITVTARDKDVALGLLDSYGIEYIKISKIANGKIGLFFELLKRDLEFYKITRKIKPDVMIGCMGPTISVVGWLMRIPRVVFYNNETAKLTNSFSQPLANAFVTSTSYEAKVHGEHITHNSYHELAYLHPNYFKPNASVLKLAGLKEGDKFFIVRFVSWQSSHDIGAKGLSNKEEFIRELEKYGKVFISSEKKLPDSLEKYKLNIPVHKMHDLMAYSSLCVGESATIAAEAALLGVPSIYIANTMRGYTNELEKDYGLVCNFKTQEEGIKKALELLKNNNLKEEWLIKREKMLNDKIDLTKWMIDFVENKKYASADQKKEIKMKKTGERLVLETRKENNKEDQAFYLRNITGYDFVENYLKEVKNAKELKVIEIGCTEGYGTEKIADRVKEITAIDKDREIIEYAKLKNKKKNIKFEEVDATKLPFEDNSFDTGVCLQVIEHIEKDEQFLSEMRRVLKPDGIFFCSTPNKSIRYVKKKPWNRFHVREYDYNEFNHLLKKYFNNVEIDGIFLKGELAEFEKKRLRRINLLNKIDFLNLRKIISPGFQSNILENIKSLYYKVMKKKDNIVQYSQNDFFIDKQNLEQCLDLMAICKNENKIN